jgi:hypothetical protein
MPLTATIAPSSSARAAAATASAAAREAASGAGASGPLTVTRGPHSGHAFGCAWNRRSRGSSYSAWQAAHIVNPAIVVNRRSYGTPVTIVKRGPQSVQLMNG